MLEISFVKKTRARDKAEVVCTTSEKHVIMIVLLYNAVSKTITTNLNFPVFFIFQNYSALNFFSEHLHH